MMKHLLKKTTKQISKIALFMLCVIGASIQLLHAQTYLSQDFESAWVGSNPQAPSAGAIPVGQNWTQSRTVLIGTGTPMSVPNSANGEVDWKPTIWNATTNTWSTNPSVLTSSIALQPFGTPSGNGAAMMDDGTFGPIGTWYGSRRLESPVINLATSTSPYMRFLFHWPSLNGSATPNVKAVISIDGGTTWRVLSQILPSGEVVGVYNSRTPWQVITIPIASPLRTSTVKVGIEFTNSASGQNIFIDRILVDEFTPTTITSAQSGLWSNPSTWVGGIVPNSSNHVVIANGHSIAHDFIVTRAQNLTVNGKLTANSNSSILVQAFGDVSVGANGIYNAYSAIGVGFTRLCLGGSLVNNGKMDFGRGNAVLVWLGNKAATYSGTGTFVNGFVSQILHANEGGVTYNAPVEVRSTVGLYTGAVNPNGNLTLGNYNFATTQLIERTRGSFTSAPISDTKVIRTVSYLTTGYEILAAGLTNTIGFEIPTIDGVRLLTGTLNVTSHYNWQLGFPMTVGTGDQQGTGGLTLSRGIVISTATNMLTLNLPSTASVSGTNVNTGSPSSNHGSYITTPFRMQMPFAGTASRTMPLGIGVETNSTNGVPTKNLYYALSISPGTTPWRGQLITVNVYGSPSGTVNSPLTAVMGRRTFGLTFNGGPALPRTATVTLPFQLEDNISNNSAGEMMIAQGNSMTGPWTSRMVTGSDGSGLFRFNSNRVTTIALNSDSLFCFGTTGQVPKLWVGGATGNWNIAANWSPVGVPTANDDVNINDATGGITLSGTGPFACRNLNIGNTSVLNATSTLNIAGFIWLSGALNISSGGTVNVNGVHSIYASSININTSSSLNVGTGGVLNVAATNGDNNRYVFQGGGTFSITGNGIVNVNGGMNLSRGVFNMSGTSQLNVDPQGTGANLFSGNLVLGFGANLFVNATGGTITLVDPSATNTGAVDVLIEGINRTNNKFWTGNTFQFGNGVSTASALSGQGGWVVVGGGFPFTQMGNLVINNPVGTNRAVRLGSTYDGANTITTTGMAWRNITITAGTLDLNGLTLGVLGNLVNNGTINGSLSGSTIHLMGSANQSISGKGNFLNGILRQLYVENYGFTASLNMNVTVTNRLDINQGILAGTGILTLGNNAFSTTLNINRYGGAVSLTPVFNIAAPNLVNVNLSYTTPPLNPLSNEFPVKMQSALVSSNEVPLTDTINTLTINNSLGITFGRNVLARAASPLTLTSGIATFTTGNAFVATNVAATLPVPFTNALSWINGTVSVNMNSSTLVTRNFPVGGSNAGSARSFIIANMENGGAGISTISVTPLSGSGNTASSGLNAVSTTRAYNVQVTGAPLTAVGYVKMLYGIDDNLTVSPSSVFTPARIGFSSTPPPAAFVSLRLADNTMRDSIITDQSIPLTLGYFALGVSTGNGVVRYVGPATGSWNTASNWSSGSVPTATDEVFIGGNVTVNMPTALTASARSLYINTGAVLNDSASVFTIDSNLNIIGSYNKRAGVTNVAGTFLANGVNHFSTTNGSVVNISGGTLNIGTTAIGLANRNMAVMGDFTMTSGTLNVFGAINILGSTAPLFTNYTISGGNINIYQQGTLANLGAVNAFNQALTADNTNMYLTGGTIRIVDPNVNNTTDVFITNARARILTGTTWAFGDGTSALSGNATSSGFSINVSTNTLGNIVVNNPTGTNRTVRILAAGSFYNNLIITSGAFNQNGFNLNVLGDIVNNGQMYSDSSTSTISMIGTRQQAIGGTGLFANDRIGGLIISNSSDTLPSVALNANLTAIRTLTLTLGTLGGTGVLTLGSSTKSTTFTCTRTTGSMLLTPVFNFGGVTTTYAYNVPVPNAVVTTTGPELPPSVNTLSFANGNGIGSGTSAFIVNSPVVVNTTLTLTSGIVQTSATNLITLASTVTTPPAGGINAFISGPLAIQVNSSSNISRTFAIGKGGQFRPMTLGTFHSNGSLQTFVGEVVLGGTTGTPVAPLNALTSTRYWKLSNTASIASATNATIAITTGADDNIGFTGLARIAQGQFGSSFTSRGGSTTGTVVTSNLTFSSDSIFAIGTEATTLPVRWTGGAGTSNWGDPANWSSLAVPTISDVVNVAAAVSPVNTYPVYINVNIPVANASSLIVGANVILDLQNATLNIANKYAQIVVTNANFPSLVFANNATINMTGSDSFLVAAGTFNGANSTLNFSGSPNQWIRPSGGTVTFNNVNLTNGDKSFLVGTTYTLAGNFTTDTSSTISLSGATGTIFNVGTSFINNATAAGTNFASVTVSMNGLQSIINSPNAISTPNITVAANAITSLASTLNINTGTTFTLSGRLNAGLNTIAGSGTFAMTGTGVLGTEQPTLGVGGTITTTGKTYLPGAQIDYNANGAQVIDSVSHHPNCGIMVSVGGTKTINGNIALTTSSTSTGTLRVGVYAQAPASFADGGKVLSLNGTFNHINIMKGAGYISTLTGGLRFGGAAAGSYIRVPDGVNIGTLELNFTNVAGAVEFQSSEPMLISTINLNNLYVGVTTPTNGGVVNLSRTDLGLINLNILGNFTIGNTGSVATGTLQCKNNFISSTVTLNGNFLSANTSTTQPIIGNNGSTTLVMNGTSAQSFIFSGASAVTFLTAPLATSNGEAVLRINNPSGVVLGDATTRTYTNAGIIELIGNGTVLPTSNTTLEYSQVSGTLRYSNSSGVLSTTNNEFPASATAGPFNLAIATTGTGSVSLHAPRTINGNLFLQNGTLVTTATNLLSVGSSNTVSGSATRFQGWVNGPLARWVANTTGSREWMIGNSTGMYPIIVTHTSAPAGGYVTAEFVSGVNSVPLSPTISDAITLNVRSGSYWRLDTAIAGIGNGTYNITVNPGIYAGVTDPSAVRVIRSDDAGSTFYASGVHADGATGTYNRNAITTGLGRFYLGASSAENPLPVKLLSLSATKSEGDVLVSWITASEQNNQGFEVERSVDGKLFEQVGFVKGAGNSNQTLSYSLLDNEAFTKTTANVLYYRLKQVDVDGNESYSNIVMVSTNTENTNSLSVYPNPFTTDYTVSLTATTNAKATVELFNVQGKQVNVQSKEITKGFNVLQVTNVEALQNGIYFVKVTVNGETQVMKLVKN